MPISRVLRKSLGIPVSSAAGATVPGPCVPGVLFLAAVTTGAAGAITMGTAACVTLGDSTKARRLPDTSGMKNEVILQPSHRMYEAQIRLVGTKLVEVSTPQDLEAAINPNTAMLFFVNCADPSGEIKREEWIGLDPEITLDTLDVV